MTQISRAHQTPQPAPSKIPFFDNVRVRHATYVVGSVAIGILATLYGKTLVSLWVGGTSLIFLGRDIGVTFQEIRHTGINDSATQAKITKLTQTIFVHGIIWGMLLTGLSIALTLEGSFLVLKAALLYNDSWILLQALNNFTAIAGLWGPLSQFLLNKSDHYFYERNGRQNLAVPIERWTKAILESIQTVNLQPIWDQMAIDSSYFSYLPIHISRETIAAQIKTLNQEQIETLMNRFPYIFDIEFMERHLSPTQFDNIVKPRLVAPFKKSDIQTMYTQLLDMQRKITAVKEQLQKAKPRQQTTLLHQLNGYSRLLGHYENCFKAVEGWQHKLPASSKKIASFIQEINQLALELENKSIASLIVLLRTELNEPTDDMTTILKERAGFTDADFKSLANLFSEDKTPAILLAERGLRSLLDLQHFKILRHGDTPAKVRERIRHFLNTPTIPKDLTVPSLSRIPWESIAHRVQVLGNYIFYYGFTASMLSLQYSYFPISTTLGFGYGLLRKNRFYTLEKMLSLETVPDFTGQTLQQRSRFMFFRSYITLTALRFGSASAFLTGTLLAGTLRHYAGDHATKLKNRVQTLFRGTPATAQ